MAAQRNPTRPREATLKRLFARSGNQCAFPRCPDTLIEGETVVGKVCHIKAAQLAGPRYDPQQTAAERHGYDNLILLCGKHHTVIDDDEPSGCWREFGSVGAHARSRRNSSMRARMAGKSSAARGRATFPPLGWFAGSPTD